MQLLVFQVELLVVQQRLRYHCVLHFSSADRVFRFQTTLLCICMLLMVCLHFRYGMRIVVYSGYTYPGHRLHQVERFRLDSLLVHMKIHFRNNHFYIYKCKQLMLDCIVRWLSKDCSGRNYMAYRQWLFYPKIKCYVLLQMGRR